VGLASDDKRQAMERKKKISTINSSVQRSSTAQGTFKRKADKLMDCTESHIIVKRVRLIHVGTVRCTGSGLSLTGFAR
jgi:hypothetical protein